MWQSIARQSISIRPYVNLVIFGRDRGKFNRLYPEHQERWDQHNSKLTDLNETNKSLLLLLIGSFYFMSNIQQKHQIKQQTNDTPTQYNY